MLFFLHIFQKKSILTNLLEKSL